MTNTEFYQQELGNNFRVAQANSPTFHALHRAMMEMGTQERGYRVAFYENDWGMVSLVEGPYHISLWGGLPKIGTKLHTVKWQGASEYALIERIIKRQVG